MFTVRKRLESEAYESLTSGLHLGYQRVLSSLMKQLISILFILLILTACDLFTPRVPEPPLDNADPYAWKPPTTPEIVLENIANAFPANKANYYLDVLANETDADMNFVFQPDQGVASVYPDIFVRWGYQEEENFVRKLFQSLNVEDLQHLEWQVEQISPFDDHDEIIANYELNLSYIESRAPLQGHLKGQATLTLVQNDEFLYEITVWQDFKSDTLDCLSDLKTQVQ